MSMTHFGKASATVLLLAGLWAGSDPAAAAELGARVTRVPADVMLLRGGVTLACDNGHSYPLTARAVSVEGELVTGYLMTTPRRGVYVRLIPMGMGYRYAGKGIWLDGVRSAAVLNFGKYYSVACTVVG